jgi:hypothetical protein
MQANGKNTMVSRHTLRLLPSTIPKIRRSSTSLTCSAFSSPTTRSARFPVFLFRRLYTDAWHSVLPQLLADDFARNGFKVVVPDIFDEPCPPDALNPGSDFDLMKWFGTNGPNVTEPRIRKVLAALKASGITRVAAIGYCYGARSSFNLAYEKEIAVVVVSHPSLLQMEDIEVRRRPALSEINTFIVLWRVCIEISGRGKGSSVDQQLHDR